ncbi:MAG: asparagine synthetase B family protein [Gemmatimonadaceae bacterium]
MTAIICLVSPMRAPWRERVARRALAAMSSRGAERTAVASCGNGTVGIAGDAWETVATGESAPAVAEDRGILVVADAAIYYRDDLRRQLAARGTHSAGPSVAHLILSAYRARGAECAGRLEGDFAFIVWDATQQRVVAARDFVGGRPLFQATTPDALIVGSTIAGLLAAGVDDALDLGHLGEIAAGLALDDLNTCRRSIRRVPAAHTLVQTGDREPALMRHWSPPRFEASPKLSLEDGALMLRDLLTAAVRERLDSRGPTSVWLSGGWDSPAVFGAGMLATNGDADRVRPVSITYPTGDRGREDEQIASIASRWGATPHWIDSREIALLEGIRERAAARDEPFAHAFEQWNRALARGSRAVGSHVALEGNGGDQLFQVSLVYLADLARRGRWIALGRECRARGVRDARTLFRWAIQPTLPAPALRVATALRDGRPLRSYLERTVPSWIEPGFAASHALHERAGAGVARESGESHSAAETRWYLTAPYFPRVMTCVDSIAREEGMELRSPLLDQRVIEFAAQRPREERASRNETKRALRAAMRGVLPDEVLAPRRSRTGTTGSLFARALRAAGAALVADFAQNSRLADLGIVDPAAVRRAWLEWESTANGNLGVGMFLTLQTELWLRAQEHPPVIKRASRVTGEPHSLMEATS